MHGAQMLNTHRAAHSPRNNGGEASNRLNLYNHASQTIDFKGLKNEDVQISSIRTELAQQMQ